jgi:hypothetical protein
LKNYCWANTSIDKNPIFAPQNNGFFATQKIATLHKHSFFQTAKSDVAQIRPDVRWAENLTSLYTLPFSRFSRIIVIVVQMEISNVTQIRLVRNVIDYDYRWKLY